MIEKFDTTPGTKLPSAETIIKRLNEVIVKVNKIEKLIGEHAEDISDANDKAFISMVLRK